MNISTSTPCERTPDLILPVQAPVIELMSVSPLVTFSRRQLLIVLDFEIEAVERVELEVVEVLAEQGEVGVDPGPLYFRPSS